MSATLSYQYSKTFKMSFCKMIAFRNRLIDNHLIISRKQSSVTINHKINKKSNIVSNIIRDKNDVNDQKSQTKDIQINTSNDEKNLIQNKWESNDKNNDQRVRNQLRHNSIGIEMISSALHKRIFGQIIENNNNDIESELKTEEINKHLRAHGLKTKFRKRKHNDINDINIEKHLPKLLGNDLSQHFEIIGEKFSSKYKELAFDLINTDLIEPPKEWVFSEGWTRYTTDSNGVLVTEKVEYPLENDVVFDVEVCMNDSDGQKPTLATAVTSKAWYSWCSNRLVNCCDTKSFSQFKFNAKPTLNDLIPMGCAVNGEKLIIGHNVSFDRSYIREQYNIIADKTRFMDTMSLHICISGLTQHQRALSYTKKSKDVNELTDEPNIVDERYSFGVINPEMWNGVGSLNNLVDVYGLYCDNKETITKDPRNIFVKGSINDVFLNFQNLMTYCATDVRITHQVFKTIFPLYLDRFSHPITLAGMLEMSVMYLPVILKNWERYVSESQSIYNDQERELNLSLREMANDACSLNHNKQYSNDVWLWDLDWTTQNIRFKKAKPQNPSQEEVAAIRKNDDPIITEGVSKALATCSQLRKVQPLIPGYPRWFVEFCGKLKFDSSDSSISNEDIDWEPGPYRISTQMRSVPKLMRLMWNGYPIHYDEKHGWGYLMPDTTMNDLPDRVPGGVDDHKNTIYFPMSQFKKVIEKRQNYKKIIDPSTINDPFLNQFEETELEFEAENPVALKDVIHGLLFCKLPHKGGPDKRVGNPLSKDFLKKVEDGTLTAYDSEITNLVLQQSKKLSYWKNNSKRVQSQIIIGSNDGISGAILPRVVVAGTVTRRAVEPTWLTASNAISDRLGSELKAMIQCPQDYNYVGADVDSQELWIASLIGDSHFSGIHGSTGIGWMTLQGNKANGSDMHSKTATSIHITRDEAKVLNYARIYGSGQAFATRFLMQSNPHLSAKDAKEKAKKIFTETKGSRRKLVNQKTDKSIENDSNEMKTNEKRDKRQWFGGSESHMFNKLEEIAVSSEPRTPVLDCRISRALEPSIVRDNYITSRINWVVQSSAVDFLHLMLISMKWLMEEKQIEGRFSISIHDELRYLIKSEHKYSAALALQLSNLLTRSYFAYKLGFKDLPLSVAFFSSVDIDKCLRKEVNLDCKTPSNPLGLHKGYGIAFGESLDIIQLMKKIDATNE